MHSRLTLALLPLLLMPLGFSALVVLPVAESPASQVALLGFTVACGMGAVVSWWLLALAWAVG